MSDFMTTDSGIFTDRNSLCLAYFSAIRETFYFFCKDDDLADELSQEFVVRKLLATPVLVEKYSSFCVKHTAKGKPRPKFRSYLVSSIRNFWRSHHRHPIRKEHQASDNSPILDVPDREHTQENLDPDAFYAYAILNRALHNVRNYCRQNGKEAHWTIFDELVLAPLDISRTPETRESLRLRFFPNAKSNQKLDNILVSMKRMVYRNLKALFTRDHFTESSGGYRSATTCIDEWIYDLKQCDSSIHGAMVAATRVTPSVDSELVYANSISVMQLSYPEEEVALELGFAASLRMKLPIVEWTEWRDPGELLRFLPAKSPFLPERKSRTVRPLTFEMLMSPWPTESEEVKLANVDALLRKVKELARSLSKMDSNPVDQHLFQFVYTLSITIARVSFGHQITSLSEREQQDGISYYILQPWLDEQTRAYLRNALSDFEQSSEV